MALGNILRGRKQFAECADATAKGIATIAKPRAGQLGDLLFPRHLLRALQAVAEGRGRSQEGARALSRPAARAQLSRLFLGRPGHQSRRGHAHDPARGRAARRRRLHRRFARLGLLPDRQLRRGGEAARTARSSSSPRIRPSTITWATPIGGSAARSRRTFQWSHARDLKPEPEDLDEDRGEAQDRAARRAAPPPTPPSRRSPATAAEASAAG